MIMLDNSNFFSRNLSTLLEMVILMSIETENEILN